MAVPTQKLDGYELAELFLAPGDALATMRLRLLEEMNKAVAWFNEGPGPALVKVLNKKFRPDG